MPYRVTPDEDLSAAIDDVCTALSQDVFAAPPLITLNRKRYPPRRKVHFAHVHARPLPPEDYFITPQPGSGRERLMPDRAPPEWRQHYDLRGADA